MKKTMMAVLLVVGCDHHSHDNDPPTGKEEAGQVAIGCLDQMKECDDWVPIRAEKTRSPKILEECDSYEYECKLRNKENTAYNQSIAQMPAHRSPCQQKFDSCVGLVDALVGGAAKEVHHHHAK